MRILLISQYFWPENFRVNDLVTGLAERGHEITVMTGLPNYPEGTIFEEFAREPERFGNFQGVPVIRVPMIARGRSKIRLVFNYISFLFSGLFIGAWKLRGRQFDCIIGISLSPITAVIPAILLRRLKRIPLLVWVLDLWPETLTAVGVVKSPRVLASIGYLVSYIYRRTDHILVQSRAFLENVSRYAGPGVRVDYFPGWAEPIFSAPLTAIDPAPETTPYLDTFNVLFAGNVGEAQDFPAILDAAAALADRPDIRILVVGDGSAFEWTKGEIARRNLVDRIVLLGRHPLERMPSFFCAADALLVTLKRNDTFSMTIPGKVQSYLATGIPLIGMLDGEGARVIEQAGAGLTCSAGQGDRLAAQIRSLADMPEDARRYMGERGKAFCAVEFDRANLLTKLEYWMTESRR